MTGTYLLRIPAIRGACPEFLSASLTGGIATHHLHTEYQFATPADRSGVSLGGLRRIAVQPGEVIVVPPCTVHSEASVPGAEVAWHILHLPRVTLRRLARDGTYETARNPSGSPLYHDPTLAAMLADLVTAAAGNSLGSEDFLRRTRHWVEELVQRHGYPDSPVGHRASIDRARVYLLHEPTRALSLDEVARQAGTTPRHLARSFGPAVGLSLQRYHAQLRLAHAHSQLGAGRPAIEVSYECGFADQSHLTRRFKQGYGLTPGALQGMVVLAADGEEALLARESSARVASAHQPNGIGEATSKGRGEIPSIGRCPELAGLQS